MFIALRPTLLVKLAQLYPHYSDYVPPNMMGGEYIRAHGYPSTAPMTNVRIPSAPITNPLHAGMQFGLLGAASGLGYSTIRAALHKQKPGGLGLTRDVLIGALIGTTFGALAAKENQRRFPERPVNSYSDVSRAIHNHLNKQGMVKRSIPILPLAFGAMGLWSGAQALRSGGRAIGSAVRGDWAGAAGHGLSALGNAAMALPGAGPLARFARLAKFTRPAVRPLANAGRVSNRLYGTGAKTMAGRVGGMAAGTAATMAPSYAGEAILRGRSAATTAPQMQRPAMGANLLRAIPPPQRPEFRTLL